MSINDRSESEEQMRSIVWPRAGFRMELDSEAWFPDDVKPFYSSIIGIDITNLNLCPMLIW
jgi:hypothetical protein